MQLLDLHCLQLLQLDLGTVDLAYSKEHAKHFCAQLSDSEIHGLPLVTASDFFMHLLGLTNAVAN